MYRNSVKDFYRDLKETARKIEEPGDAAHLHLLNLLDNPMTANASDLLSYELRRCFLGDTSILALELTTRVTDYFKEEKIDFTPALYSVFSTAITYEQPKVYRHIISVSDPDVILEKLTDFKINISEHRHLEMAREYAKCFLEKKLLAEGVVPKDNYRLNKI